MIIHLGKRWPQQPGCIAIVSVGFITGGSPHHQALVMDAAKEWERCNIKLDWGPPEESHVRIAFNTESSFSYLGIDAKGVDSKKPTMGLDVRDNDRDLRSTILHEFGHTLGAVHEYFSPYFPYDWNRVAIENYFEEKLGSREKTVDKLDIDIVRQTRPNQPHHLISTFDEKSIMMYSMKRDWLRRHDKFKQEPKRLARDESPTMMDIQKMKEAYTR
jgi:hypothetical protein